MRPEHETKHAKVIIAGALFLSLLMLSFAWSLRSEAAVLWQPTGTTTVGTYDSIAISDRNGLVWDLDCNALGIADVTAVTVFGKAQNAATGTYQMHLGNRLVRDTTGWGTSAYANRRYDFSAAPATCRSDGILRMHFNEYNFSGNSALLLLETASTTACGNTSLPEGAFTGGGDTLPSHDGGVAAPKLGTCPSMIIEGTALVATPEEPSAVATSTHEAATVQFAFFSLWSMLAIGALTYVIINKR